MLFRKGCMLSLLMAFSLLIWTAQAQGQTRNAFQNQSSSFTGLEVTPGWVENDDVYGWVCYGRLTGQVNGNMTLTMDYAGLPVLGGSQPVERGTWTIPVYTQTIRGLTYMGVIYGAVAGGEIQWDTYGNATIMLDLTITGGSQTLQGSTGKAQLFLSSYWDGSGTRMKGDIYFL